MVKLSIPTNFSSKNFISTYKFLKKKVIINLSVSNLPLTMDAFPGSRQALKKFLPSIFQCKCFNPENQSFYRESKKTEIAHLFEHIILEYMCMEKIQYTDEISYSGKTTWDSRNMTGKFKIIIECSLADSTIFTKALKKSIQLMDVILSEEKAMSFNTQRKQTLQKTVSFGN